MGTPQKANPRSGRLQKVLELLGGARILSQSIAGPLDVHELLHHGLPASALGHLVGKLVYIQKADSLKGHRDELTHLPASEEVRFRTSQPRAERSNLEVCGNPIESD